MNFFKDLQLFFGSASHSLRGLLNIQDGTAIDQTVVSIRKNIDMKGANLWILFASAVIASVGLDQDSGAVIIGAMLISPLMGPILGVGLSVGINDKVSLFKSIRNLVLATSVSLLASYLYFVITPLGKMTPSMLARTSPNSLDTIIAFAGGIAGIVAGSRRDQTTAIPGVAIATALMPPICTAGFGLASGRLNVFFGAFYLFFLNAIFIALATYLIVRFLKFPYKEQVDASTQTRVKRAFIVFVLLIFVPSIYTLYNLVSQERLNAKVDQFVDTEIKQKMEDLYYDGHTISSKDDSVIVKMSLLGSKAIDSQLLVDLNRSLNINYDLANARLEIIQNNRNKFEKELLAKIEEQNNFVLEEVYSRNQSELQSYKTMAYQLEKKLQANMEQNIPILEIKEELKIHYPSIDDFKYAHVISDRDTVLTFMIKWQASEQSKIVQESQLKIKEWLKLRLKKDTITVSRWSL